MQLTINENIIEIIQGDLTKQETNAIVNAANGRLLGGGGVDGAIHRAAGPELLEACKKIREIDLQGAYLQTGEVVMTEGFKLPAKYVLHTVGPIWEPQHEALQRVELANCYWNSLKLAQKHGLTSIAFPAISTGVYNYPPKKAAKIALNTIATFLENNTFGKVIITLFSDNDLAIYRQIIEEEFHNTIDML